MKTKARIILHSLADLSAGALPTAGSFPGPAAGAPKQVSAVSARVTRRELRAARRRSLEVVRDYDVRASVSLDHVQSWPHWGIND